MTAKIKLNAASGGGSISIQAPSSSSNNRVISLPDIADGTLVTSESTLDATKLSGDLPAISGANLTGISAGITMADSWKMNQSINYNSNDYLTSSWERVTGTLGGNVGSAMSESSGVFTFPTTGLYYVELNVGFYHGSSAGFLGVSWRLSTDGGSSYPQVTSGYVGGGSGAHYDRLRLDEFFDVTNASNFKMKFQLILPAQSTVQGGNGRTTLKVVKYGET